MSFRSKFGRSIKGLVLALALHFAAVVHAETLKLPGLSESVEIVQDSWGISHIYAKNQNDLFFAQGFNVARDRLFQLEMWRRRATGTLAELIGTAALRADTRARLLRPRVDMDAELAHYHRDGKEIIISFVAGINAYVDVANANPEALPIEFRLLGFKPGHWTPEVVVARHNGLYRNVSSEISRALALREIGAELLEDLVILEPGDQHFEVAEGLDLSLLNDDTLGYYRARSARFTAEHIVDPENRAESEMASESTLQSASMDDPDNLETVGSNNWVVSGSKTDSGLPYMSNDPHRSQQVPSLRYWVHLNAPGWNVIGGGEPSLPGVSIGHNEHGAWGLTISAIDQEDLYVYKINPKNANQYWYNGAWESMEVESATILVKGQDAETVELKYTRHGPVLSEDAENHNAYALRAAWLEVGGAPYLASLRIDQVTNWEEFRDACSFHRFPSENMVWADVHGDIGWQAVGATPIRGNWNGLLPVPGDGRFEWKGYLPIKQLPHVHNPGSGFWGSANENNVPVGYPHMLGYAWSAPFRSLRIHETLESKKTFSIEDMKALQVDEVSLPARDLTPLLGDLRSENAHAARALDLLRNWDYTLRTDSVEATIYTAWQSRLVQDMKALVVPEELLSYAPSPAMRRVIAWLTEPDSRFGEDPEAGRDALILNSFEEAIAGVRERLGNFMEDWNYGQEEQHHIRLTHMLSASVNEELRAILDLGPLPRGGSSFTVNNTAGNRNQRSGASLRIVADLSDWDNSVGANNPGQSGDPASPHYADLFPIWAANEFFPIYFSREKVDSAAESTMKLEPGS